MQLIIFVLLTILFVLYAVLILYYAASWRAIPDCSSKQPLQSPPFISIIIPARNEEENIIACLHSVLQQSYPANCFEVIVVDDHSTDNTAALVQSLTAPNLHLVKLGDYKHAADLNAYKKKALATGIAQSKGELIVTTDADCIVPPQWLLNIAAFYQEHNAAFIAMPVKFSSNHTALSIFQSLDFMTLQGITGASVYKRIHSMCNGANLAYTRKAFDEVNGFTGIDHIASGDDMLLMHKIYQQQPESVYFLKSKQVIAATAPMPTLRSFFNQRIRWASKADQYDDKRIFAVLVLVYLFNLLMLILPMVSLFTWLALPAYYSPSTTYYWLLLLAAKTIVELIFLYPVAQFFSQAKLLWWFPLAQPFHIAYTVIAGWLGKFGSYQWKERRVK